MPATHPRHGERISPGRIYVAPPDRHLLVADRQILLSSLPREHFTRPAVDPLFRSAVRSFGARVVGVVLSGTGSDGATGLAGIRKAGGLAVVQNPADAPFPEMPETALRAVTADYVVPGAALGSLLAKLAATPVSIAPATPAAQPIAAMELEQPPALTCPECGGAVHEVGGTGILSYRCHTGHRFSADELVVRQVDDVERALMVAVRVLSERTALCRRMMNEAQAGGRSHGIAYWSRLKAEADEQLRVLQRFLHMPPLEEEETRSEAKEGQPVGETTN
jgi:two-component system chemotaxis response regulator CheB